MKLFYFTYGCIFFIVLDIQGQETGDTLFIKPGNYLLEEMTVSANRWEQNPAEIPARIAHVKLAEIRIQNPQTAADLLGLTHGVFIQKSQLGGGSPIIRGFGTNRVLLVLDGVRLNNAIFRSGNVQNLISLDANAIAQAEVIFGPGSVIYGSDAIGGVMDFHTLRPAVARNEKLFIHGNALTRYSSANNERTIHADLNLGFSRWGLLSSFTQSSYSDLRMGKRGPFFFTRPDRVIRFSDQDVQVANDHINLQSPSGYDQVNVMQKIHFIPVPEIEITYAFHYSETSSYARYDRLLLRSETGTLANAEWNYGPQKWLMHSLQLSHRKSTLLSDEIRMVIAYQEFNESRHNRAFGRDNRNNRFEKVNALSMNIDNVRTITNATKIFYGADVVFNKVNSRAFATNIHTGQRNAIATRYPDNSSWNSYAAYLSIRSNLSDPWTLSASMRYSRVYAAATFDRTFFPFPFEGTKIDHGAVNGSAGTTYNSNRGLKWYANLSTGFRAPNIDDLGKVFDSSPGVVVVPNPSLRPEYAYNAESGIVTAPGKKIRFDLTAYYTFLDDALQRGNYVFQGNEYIEYDNVTSRVQALQNISFLQVYGFQAGVILNLPLGLRLNSIANVQAGKEKDKESGQFFTPSHVAPFFGSTSLKFLTEKWRADLYVIYNGKVTYDRMPLSERADEFLYKKDNSGNPYVPAWMTLNFKSSCTINKFLTLDAGIENILDRRYRPFASGITSPGRNVVISIRSQLNSKRPSNQ